MRVLLAALAIACTHAQTLIKPSVLVVPRPGAPGDASCVLDGKAWEYMCAPDFDVHDASGNVIARVARPTYTHVVWSGLPLVGGSLVVPVTVSASGLAIEGRASIAEQQFIVKRSIEVVGTALRIPAGAPVSILGTTGGQIAISVPTSFAAPARIETTAPCDAFGHASVETVRSGPPYARPRSRSIALHAAPGGDVVFAFAPHETDSWVWLGEQGSMVHVLGGHYAWRKNTDRTSLVFDGWVRASDVEKVDSIDSDWDSGCDPPDTMDTCGPAYAARDANVVATPKGPTVGALAKGSYLRRRAREARRIHRIQAAQRGDRAAEGRALLVGRRRPLDRLHRARLR